MDVVNLHLFQTPGPVQIDIRGDQEEKERAKEKVGTLVITIEYGLESG